MAWGHNPEVPKRKRFCREETTKRTLRQVQPTLHTLPRANKKKKSWTTYKKTGKNRAMLQKA